MENELFLLKSMYYYQHTIFFFEEEIPRCKKIIHHWIIPAQMAVCPGNEIDFVETSAKRTIPVCR